MSTYDPLTTTVKVGMLLKKSDPPRTRGGHALKKGDPPTTRGGLRHALQKGDPLKPRLGTI